MNHESVRVVKSAVCAGVQFSIARISFARRLELTRRVRELGRRIAFDEAGEGMDGKLTGAIARGEIDRLYLEWGLLAVEGLEIDNVPAGVTDAIEHGPEELCREIVTEIRRECGLDEAERKN